MSVILSVILMMAEQLDAQVSLMPMPLPESTQTSALQGLFYCTCARHQGSALLAPNTAQQLSRSFGVAGIRILDSLPAGATVISELRYEVPASPDSSENVGYKKFYALLHLKAQAAQHGANALIGLRHTLDRAGSKVIFSATAAKVAP
ncbi:MAG: hypothetical protein RMI34_08100 [Chloroherpetonaceae bacterium]|nr:hypothetical protein [Chloroherpetonaceae bacterium]MDW8020019.1 hypothetical protein [Chloroherpetonaceae bacterium]